MLPPIHFANKQFFTIFNPEKFISACINEDGLVTIAYEGGMNAEFEFEDFEAGNAAYYKLMQDLNMAAFVSNAAAARLDELALLQGADVGN